MRVSEAISGDLVGWRGLPAGLTQADLVGQLAPIRATQGPTDEIRISRRFRVLRFERDAAPHLIEGWFPLGDDDVTLVEYDEPVLPDVDSLLAAYGPPDLLLDYPNRYAPGARVREHVFAERGITLSIAEPYAGGGRTAVHIQLYQPTTDQGYVTRIGPGPDLKPFPNPPPTPPG